MYTNIKWDHTGELVKGNGNSFLFKFEGEKIYATRAKKGQVEVCHSSHQIFNMNGFAVKNGGLLESRIPNTYNNPRGLKSYLNQMTSMTKTPVQLEEMEIYKINQMSQ